MFYVFRAAVAEALKSDVLDGDADTAVLVFAVRFSTLHAHVVGTYANVQSALCTGHAYLQSACT